MLTSEHNTTPASLHFLSLRMFTSSQDTPVVFLMISLAVILVLPIAIFIQQVPMQNFVHVNELSIQLPRDQDPEEDDDVFQEACHDHPQPRNRERAIAASSRCQPLTRAQVRKPK